MVVRVGCEDGMLVGEEEVAPCVGREVGSRVGGFDVRVFGGITQ